MCVGDPQPGGALTVGRGTATQSLNPHHTPGGSGDTGAIGLIYENLVVVDRSGQTQDIHPGVAESWEVADDGLSYVFHIRDGATFSNGRAVTAEDVKYSLDRWADPEKNQWADFARGYESTTVIDDSTVRINMSEPIGAFLHSLAMIAAAVLPAEELEAQGDAFFENPIGSGAYKLDEWVKGSSISFTRNEHYWDPEVPLLDEIEYRFITDDNSRILALKAGDVGLVDTVPWSQVASVKEDSSVVLETYDRVHDWVLLSMNHQRPELQDPKVRQALSLAIDREAINEKFYFGMAEVPNSMLPRLKYDAEPDVVPTVEYDLEAAKKLMSESDQPDGFTATFEYAAGNPTFESVALILKDAWAELGVEIELVPNDQPTRSKNFTGGTYDIMIPYALAASDVSVPDEFAAFYAIPGSTNGFYTWWTNEEMEEMVTEFVSSTDEDERAEMWPKIQAAFLEHLPSINVLDLPKISAHAKDVCGFTPAVRGSQALFSTWIAKGD